MLVANFLSGLLTYKTVKTEQDGTSVFAAPATLNAPVLSTIFETTHFKTFQNFPPISDLLSAEVSKSQHHTKLCTVLVFSLNLSIIIAVITD
jgi:hypothetical protein